MHNQAAFFIVACSIQMHFHLETQFFMLLLSGMLLPLVFTFCNHSTVTMLMQLLKYITALHLSYFYILYWNPLPFIGYYSFSLLILCSMACEFFFNDLNVIYCNIKGLYLKKLGIPKKTSNSSIRLVWYPTQRSHIDFNRYLIWKHLYTFLNQNLNCNC